jgi:hypothetical protein
MLGIEGALPAPEGMKLRTCLESLVGVPARGDERSQEQRQADALSELCARAIGSGRLPRQGGLPLCRRKHHPQVTEGGYRRELDPGRGYALVAPPGAELRPDRRRRLSPSRRRGP